MDGSRLLATVDEKIEPSSWEFISFLQHLPIYLPDIFVSSVTIARLIGIPLRAALLRSPS